jgi:tRNA (cytidine32/uridine32-2'-O)-methyltransferase
MRPDRIEVVLVRPSRPGNVAAACRALKNMGIERLTLVGRSTDFVGREARPLAYGAWDLLDSAQTADSLRDAVAGCSFVAATTGRPGESRFTLRSFFGAADGLVGAGRLGLVFGPEATGLTNDELALCHAHITIPTHPAHSSLNLAQAVAIVAYEARASGGEGEAESRDEPARATAGELEAAIQDLGEGLRGIGYLNASSPGPILAELRRLLARAAPTRREVTLLRGIARQISWAARRVAGSP